MKTEQIIVISSVAFTRLCMFGIDKLLYRLRKQGGLHNDNKEERKQGNDENDSCKSSDV